MPLTNQSVGTNGMRAAQYLRTSTENQKYSLENQMAAIAVYAACRGIEIAHTYTDKAKSGISLAGRPALTTLLDDVRSGSADFELILVYDVSRWGRFQDVDEAAHHEFLCNQAGVSIRYCAEEFDDSGIVSNLFKTLKRIMAAEYLRELSAKTFDGQCRTVHYGFRPGGMTPYGLKRMLVAENGTVKCALLPGQYKSIQSERVILAPGCAAEVEVVNRIFKLFVFDRRSKDRIAEILNREGAPRGPHSPSGIWRRARVHNILINENYIGNIVFNRRTQRLKAPSKPNPSNEWLRHERAFVGIVEPQLFRAAQRLIFERRRKPTNAELLEALSKLHQRTGTLSRAKINECKNVCDSTVYRRRFGSLWNAYALIGHPPPRNHSKFRHHADVYRAFNDLQAAVIAEIEATGASVVRAGHRALLKINDDFILRIVLLTPRHRPCRNGSRHWRMFVRTRLHYDIALAARVEDTDFSLLDYYLLPRFEFHRVTVALGDSSWSRYNAFRVSSLRPLAALCSLSQSGRKCPSTADELKGFLESI